MGRPTPWLWVRNVQAQDPASGRGSLQCDLPSRALQGAAGTSPPTFTLPTPPTALLGSLPFQILLPLHLYQFLLGALPIAFLPL